VHVANSYYYLIIPTRGHTALDTAGVSVCYRKDSVNLDFGAYWQVMDNALTVIHRITLTSQKLQKVLLPVNDYKRNLIS